MPFSAFYGLLTLALVGGTFLVFYKLRGWKAAIGVSLLVLVFMSISFLVLLTLALRAMG